MTQFPSLFSIIQTGLHNYTVFIQAIDISGNPDTISSETYASLKFDGSRPNFIDLGNTDSFDYTITTKYTDAWENYFKGNLKEIAREAELKYGTDFRLDSNNYSDKVSLKFLAGSNNQNRYRLFLRESVITAEIGTKNSFNYTATSKPPVANFSSNVIKGYAPLSV